MIDIDKQIIKNHNKFKKLKDKEMNKYKEIHFKLKKQEKILDEKIKNFQDHYEQNKLIITKHSKLNNIIK